MVRLVLRLSKHLLPNKEMTTKKKFIFGLCRFLAFKNKFSTFLCQKLSVVFYSIWVSFPREKTSLRKYPYISVCGCKHGQLLHLPTRF